MWPNRTSSSSNREQMSSPLMAKKTSTPRPPLSQRALATRCPMRPGQTKHLDMSKKDADDGYRATLSNVAIPGFRTHT